MHIYDPLLLFPPRKLHDSTFSIFTATRSDHIWSIADIRVRASQSSFYSFGKIVSEGFLCDELYPTRQCFSQKKNIIRLLLFYRDFPGKHSNEQHSLVPLVYTFTTNTRHITYTRTNHSHYLGIPLIRRKVHSDSSFPITSTLYNRPQRL